MEVNKGELTEEHCTTVLRNYLKSEDFKLTSHTMRPLSETREGLIGEHFIVTLEYETNNKSNAHSFFLKVLNGSSRVLFELAQSIKAYEKEEFFYTVVLEESRNRGIDTSFAPACYLCKPYSIVLENLANSGFKGTPKSKPLDLAHCKSSLVAIAKFHAAGITYEELRTKEDGSIFRFQEAHPEFFTNVLFGSEENSATRWLKASMEGILELVDLIPEDGISSVKFKEKLLEVLQEMSSEDGPSSDIRNTILHGDLWSNNQLHRYKDGQPIQSKLIDYQVTKYGPPSLDVVQFLLTNTRKKFREAHYDELLCFYYESLNSCLSSAGLDSDVVLTKEEFLAVCEKVKVEAKLHTLADRSITLMSDDEYSEAVASDEALEKFIFDDRSKHIVQSFKQSDEFRDVITEDMLELRSMLFDGQ